MSFYPNSNSGTLPDGSCTPIKDIALLALLPNGITHVIYLFYFTSDLLSDSNITKILNFRVTFFFCIVYIKDLDTL